jgi:hypothetical protein
LHSPILIYSQDKFLLAFPWLWAKEDNQPRGPVSWNSSSINEVTCRPFMSPTLDRVFIAQLIIHFGKLLFDHGSRKPNQSPYRGLNSTTTFGLLGSGPCNNNHYWLIWKKRKLQSWTKLLAQSTWNTNQTIMEYSIVQFTF